jgi:hypothetical protein
MTATTRCSRCPDPKVLQLFVPEDPKTQLRDVVSHR